MKTKRKTFGSFFVRVGTSFLAFWLVLMGAFTLLLGQQRAQLMLSEMENRADFFDGNFGKYLLDSKELGTDDTAQLRRALRWQSSSRGLSGLASSLRSSWQTALW